VPVPLNEMFIDNFAGGGGASTGIEKAIGRSVAARECNDVQMKHKSHVVLGIFESLRSNRANTWLLSSIGGMMPADIEFRIYQGLASLPHFSPDLDSDEAQSNEAVNEWSRGSRLLN
jgi:hypothetical protein